MVKKQNTAKDMIYQLKITLKNSKPPIWRRVLVPGKFNLGKLHAVIQYAMGWTDSHLHHFHIYDRFYGVPQSGDWLEELNEEAYSLAKVVPEEKCKFIYEYDFGDSWVHLIVVEKILPLEVGKVYPVCIAGKRACPPEDVGGVWGYEDLLEAINDPENEEYDSYLDWVGEDFDPEEFDLDSVNALLKNIK